MVLYLPGLSIWIKHHIGMPRVQMHRILILGLKKVGQSIVCKIIPYNITEIMKMESVFLN